MKPLQYDLLVDENGSCLITVELVCTVEASYKIIASIQQSCIHKTEMCVQHMLMNTSMSVACKSSTRIYIRLMMKKLLLISTFYIFVGHAKIHQQLLHTIVIIASLYSFCLTIVHLSQIKPDFTACCYSDVLSCRSQHGTYDQVFFEAHDAVGSY